MPWMWRERGHIVANCRKKGKGKGKSGGFQSNIGNKGKGGGFQSNIGSKGKGGYQSNLSGK
eukprot:5677202-Karenia_brevis.AAC.1